MDDPDSLLPAVHEHLLGVLGPVAGRASVAFLGAAPIEVLRFGPDPEDLCRYVTLGMCRAPMGDPASQLVASEGPRAELVLSVRGRQDSVLRSLAALAASPTVEGLVLAPGAGLDLGRPLWDGGRFPAVLLGAPGGLIPDLVCGGGAPVRFLPAVPMTPNEAAWKRVHGAAALEMRWLAQALDLRDPHRREVELG